MQTSAFEPWFRQSVAARWRVRLRMQAEFGRKVRRLLENERLSSAQIAANDEEADEKARKARRNVL